MVQKLKLKSNHSEKATKFEKIFHKWPSQKTSTLSKNNVDKKSAPKLLLLIELKKASERFK